MNRRRELRVFGCFFALLFTLSILRPLRDDLVIGAGASHIPWLFSSTFGVMLVVAPLFGLLASRAPRSRIARWTFGVLLAQLLAFYVVLKLALATRWAVPAFFVWLSVFNLLAVSVAWSWAGDVFDTRGARGRFGLPAAGAGAGALAGPAVGAWLSLHLPPLELIPCAAASLALAALAARPIRGPGDSASSLAVPLGGGAFDGARMTVTTPHLRGLALLVVAYTLVSTLLYVLQATLLAGSAGRLTLLASTDLASNLLALVLQVLVTGRVLRSAGPCLILGLVPAVVAVGLVGLGVWPAVPLLTIVVVLHRAGGHALLRPAREALFAGLDAASRYKAKSFVDTVVYRGSDTLGAWVATAVGASAWGLAGTAALGALVALASAFVAVWLGRWHATRTA